MKGSKSGLISVAMFFAAGRRPPRGVRKHNRNARAEERREGFRALCEASKPKTKDPADAKSRKGTAYMPPVREVRPEQLPQALKVDLQRMAKNQKGDCPSCGASGMHPLAKFCFGEQIVELRRCKKCWIKFNDLPKMWEDLPQATGHVICCPLCAAADFSVESVLCKEGGWGEALKCPKGHLFRRPALKRRVIQYHDLRSVAVEGLADEFGTFDWPKLYAEMGVLPSIAMRYFGWTT